MASSGTMPRCEPNSNSRAPRARTVSTTNRGTCPLLAVEPACQRPAAGIRWPHSESEQRRCMYSLVLFVAAFYDYPLQRTGRRFSHFDSNSPAGQMDAESRAKTAKLFERTSVHFLNIRPKCAIRTPLEPSPFGLNHPGNPHGLAQIDHCEWIGL
jgi:hypothetical protein